jgi:DNA-binding MarR family transcriptional regulator
MLMDLLRAAERRRKISVSSLTLASRVPATTALRQIALLKSRAMIETEPDPFDKRRVHVRLTNAAHPSIENYLADLAAKRHIMLLPSELIGTAAE